MGRVTRESKCHLKFQFFKMLEVKKGKKRRGKKEAYDKTQQSCKGIKISITFQSVLVLLETIPRPNPENGTVKSGLSDLDSD